MTSQQIENIGNAAVMLLRSTKLKSGLPFMINSKELPTNVCYLEYPDGNIALVTIKKNDTQFTLIRNLSEAEISQVRSKFKLGEF